MGTSRLLSRGLLRCRDHPHACGDKKKSYILSPIVTGSSPRVWGQGNRNEVGGASHGIIPTRVGTRRYVQPTSANGKDHPHACGDKEFGIPSCVKASGSSPRVWGQVNNAIRFGNTYGIIPTRVGTRFICVLLYFASKDHPHACGDK